MSEKSETVLPRRRRVWLRRVLWATLCLLLLLSLLGVIAWRWLKSDSFNQYIARQIEAGAPAYGLKIKVGGFSWSWDEQTANLRELVVTNERGQPVADIQAAQLAVEILKPYERRAAVLRRLTLDGVTLHAMIDEQGQTNFVGLRQPPKKDEFIKLDSSRLAIQIINSQLNFNDARTKLMAALQGLQADIQLTPDAPTQAVIKQANGKISFAGRAFSLDELQAKTAVSANGLQVESLQAHSQLGGFTASGKLAEWQAPRYEFAVTANSELAEVMRVFAPSADVRGGVTARGQVTGTASQFVFVGNAQASDLTFSQTRLRNVTTGVTQVKVQGSNVTFTADKMRAGALTVASVKLADLALSGVQGKAKNSQFEISAQTATLAQTAWQGGNARAANLRKVKFALDGKRYQAEAETAIAGVEVTLGGRFDKLAFGPTTTQLKLDNDFVKLAQLKTTWLTAAFTGAAEIALSRTGVSHVKTQFDQLPTNQLLAFAAFKPEQLPFTGQVNGAADVRFNNNFNNNDARRVSGALNLTFDGKGTDTVNGVPLNGVVALQADNGVFNVTNAQLKTDVTTVNASGNVALDGNSDLQIQLVSTEANQFTTLAKAFEPAQKFIQQYEPLLTGALTFNGRLTGPLEAPTLIGALNAASIGAQDALLGALSGKLSVTPDELRFEQGQLTASNGGGVKFDLLLPVRNTELNNGKLTATLDRLELETLLGVSGAPAALDFITGNVSGQLALSGLPNALRGGGKLALLEGKIVKQAADLAEIEFRLDGRNVLLDRLEARLLQSGLLASGAVNLDDKQFKLAGEAQQIALARLAEAFELTTAVITGTADAKFNVSGAFDNVENLKVELTAQGQNVNVNGRDTGELKLTARTDASGRIDAELITGILATTATTATTTTTAGGKRQPEIIKAQLELRQAGKPIVIESTLADLDLLTVLTAFAPDYADTFKGKLNGKFRLAGPTVNAQGEASFEQLRGQVLFDAIELSVLGNDLQIATPLVVELAGPQIKLPQTKITGQGLELTLGGALGWQDEARMDFAVNGALTLANLPALIPDTRLDGVIALNHIRITGTAEKPILMGEILLRDIGVTAPDAPAAIEQGQGRLTLNGDQAVLESFTARVNDGTLDLKGEAKFDGLRLSEWRGEIVPNNLDILYDEVRATVSGKLTLTGNPQGQTLSGTLTVPSAEYTGTIDLDGITTGRVVSSNLGRFNAPGIGNRNPGLPPINLNVRVEARDSLIIRDDEINTVASALLTLSGPLTDPNMSGRVSAEGGSVRFRGQRYEVSTATLDFLGGAPTLNLQAEGNTSGYRINIGFIGQLDQIDLTLRSEPELTRDEILSLIATGRTESRSTGGNDPRFSGVDTVSSLLTTQLTKPAERALGLIGINRFQIDPVFRPNTNPAARATIGAQLARSLYFTFATNLAAEQDSTVLLEYTFSNSFSAIASFTQGGSGGGSGSARNNDFVLEIRGRKRFDFGGKPPAEPHLATTTPPEADPASAASRVPVGIRFNLPLADVQVVSPLKDLTFNTRLLRELLPVKTQGFSRSLSRLGERRLKNYLQEKGYFFAEVAARCEPVNCQPDNGPTPGMKVFYDVEAGERYQLTDVRFDGTPAIDPWLIGRELQSQPANALGGVPLIRDLVGGLKRGLTSNERVKADVEVIRRYLVDRGYREARVRSRFAVTEDQGLVVVFSVEAGVKSNVTDIVVRGNGLLTADELLAVVPATAGQPFSLTNALAGAQQIKALYTQRGYLEANAEVEFVELAPDRVRLVYQVNEGQQARIEGDVQIVGNVKTQASWMRRYYDFKTGEVLTPAQMRKTQRDLYATGAFREVGLRTEALNAFTGTHKVTINVTEAKPLLFVYGLGYSTDDGTRGFLKGLRGLTELSFNNIRGTLDSATLRLRASQREQFAQFAFTDLRPFGMKWPTTFSVFYNRNNDLRPFTRRRESIGGKVSDVTDNAAFGLQRFAAFVQTERKLNDLTSLRFRYNLERANLFNFKETFPETEVTRNERAVRLSIFTIGLSRDTRDNLLNPTRGQLISADNLLAAKALGGNESFNKFFANYQRYYTFDPATRWLKDSTLAFSARFGAARVFSPADRNGDGVINESERRLPISERFFSGGATTLRGFKFETAGLQGILAPRPVVQAAGKPLRFELPALVPLGGDALTVLNFELRYPLTSRLRLVPFYDLGNVFYKVRDMNWKNMTNTLGLGIRINTPLGPIGVDYGFLLDPPAFQFGQATLRQPRGAFHVRFGQTF